MASLSCGHDPENYVEDAETRAPYCMACGPKGISRHRPFSCGTQFADWHEANCLHCTKYSEDASRCDIDAALLSAQLDGGTVSTEIAERMGYLDNSPPRQPGWSHIWQCPEVDWTPEWKAECADREAERLTGTLPGMERAR